MLLKLLSQKSFLLQILFGLLFLVLLFFALYPIELRLYGILAVFILLLSVVLAWLFYNYSILVNQTAFGIWFYLIWIVAFSGVISDIRITSSFLVCSLIFWRWESVNPQFGSKRVIFDSSFLLIVSGILYPPSIFLIGFLIISYLYTQSISIRNIILLFVGLTVPVLIGLQLAYLTDKLDELQNYSEAFYTNFFNVPIWLLIPVFIMVIASWADHLLNFAAQDIHKRQKYFLSFIYFINWLIIVILFGGENSNVLIFLGLPVSVFLGRFVQYIQSDGKKEILLWIYLIFMGLFYFRNELTEIYRNLLGNVSFQL